MPGLLDFLSNLWNHYNLIIILVVLVALDHLWTRFASSEKGLRFLISVFPKSAQIHYSLGVFLAEKPEKLEEAEAEKEIRLAIGKDRRFRAAYYPLIKLLLERKNHTEEERKELYKEITKHFPNDPYGYVLRGILKEQTSPRGAEGLFREAIFWAPMFDWAYRRLAFLLQKQERFSEAEDACRKAIDLGAGDQLRLAYVLEKLGRYPEAENEYRKFIKREPNNIDTYRYLASLLCKEPPRYPEAEKVLRKAIARSPKEARLYGFLGWIMHQSGNHLEAEKLFRQSLSITPNSEVYVSLGGSLWNLQDFDAAEDAYRKAIAADPNNAHAYYNLGYLLHEKLNRYPEAETAYRKSIELDPDFSWVYINLANLLAKQNQSVEAEKLFRKAIELDPKAPVYNNLANLIRREHRFQDALRVLEKFAEADPDNFMPYMSIASVEKLLGNIDKSKEYMEKARPLIPNDDEYEYNQACLESILGNLDAAFDRLTKAAQEKSFDKTWTWEDPDLQWLRDDPRFLEIVGPKPVEAQAKS
jgi:tetratricopeptide (TPR) repeat protein